MINNKLAENTLSHFGVQGMKWGVRKASEKKNGKSKPAPSSEYTQSRALKKRSVKTLTNAEIKALNQRMQLEKTLKELNPSAITRGSNIAKGVLATATTISSIYALTNSPLGKSIKSAVKGARYWTKGY